VLEAFPIELPLFYSNLTSKVAGFYGGSEAFR